MDSPLDKPRFGGILHGDTGECPCETARWYSQGESFMHTLTRRQLLQSAGAGAAALVLAPWAARAAEDKAPTFTLPPLPYPYDALEPYIDAETMKIHHDLHHKAYVDNLNKAVAKHPELAGKSVDELLRNIKAVPQDIQQAVIDHGGGHANHTLFWEIMAKNAGGKPTGALAQAITNDLGDFDKVQATLSQRAVGQFGSGWAWLAVGDGGKLHIVATLNQNSPLLMGMTPLLGIDVWEHAYYLKYRNRRADYVKAWWNVVNWNAVAERYEKAKRHG
jgi:Fe-Mn family superoxide dismutase